MRERIVFESPDGSILVVNPAGEPKPGESVEAYLDRVAARAVAVDPALAGCVRLAILDVDDFPSRRFRSHWRFAGRKIHTDRSGAMRQIMAEVRAARDESLKVSDAEKLKLNDTGDAKQKKDYAAYRQSLRDFPAAVEAEIASLSVEALEVYKLKLPEKPK